MSATTRHTAVDLIRLFALIGICVVNVIFLGLPTEAAFTPPENLPDQIAAFIIEMLFQSKFFIIFSFLFGWGIYIQKQSAQRANQSFAGRYARRLLTLAVMGCLHAIFVFTGDILFIYALLGFLIWPLIHLPSKKLLYIAAAMVPASVISLIILALILPAEFTTIKSYSIGGTFKQATFARINDWPETLGFLLLFQGPLAFGAFTTGLAAAKTQFFAPDSKGRKWLTRSIPWLVIIGAPLNILYAASMSEIIAPSNEILSLIGFISISLGAPMFAALYIQIMLFLNDHIKIPDIFISAGKNSLSTYVFQGILAGGIFGGYGFGLFNTIGIADLFAIGVLTALLTITIIGTLTQYTKYGPLEALLRRITYLRI